MSNDPMNSYLWNRNTNLTNDNNNLSQQNIRQKSELDQAIQDGRIKDLESQKTVDDIKRQADENERKLKLERDQLANNLAHAEQVKSDAVNIQLAAVLTVSEQKETINVQREVIRDWVMAQKAYKDLFLKYGKQAGHSENDLMKEAYALQDVNGASREKLDEAYAIADKDVADKRHKMNKK